MHRLRCTFAEFIDIIKARGFSLHRHDGGSHQQWRAEIDGRVYYVTVSGHNLNGDVPPGTLASMIRQSGLPKRLFIK